MAAVTIRDRLIVGPMCTPAWGLEQDLALYTELGLKTVNLSTRKLDAFSKRTWKSMIASAGISVDTLLMQGIGFDLNEPGGWLATRRRLLEALEAATELDARRCMFCGGSGHGSSGALAASRFVEAIEPIQAVAKDLKIQLLLEPVRPQFAHLGFVHSIRDGVVLAQGLGIGLVFDVVHCWWEPGLAELLGQYSALIGLVQLADLNFSAPILDRVLPGDGELSLPAMIAPLVGSGYSGLFEIELVGAALEAEGYRRSILRALKYLGELELPLAMLGCP